MSEDISITVNADDTTVKLPYEMPQAEYMYGCTATAVGMLLGYYDLYGYMGVDASHLIEGTISVHSRGSDGNIYNMNEFDSVLGNFIANKDYVARFYDNNDPDAEMKYSFVIDEKGQVTGLNTANFTCLADWLGTGQYGRGGEDLSTTFYYSTLADTLASSQTYTITVGETKYTIPIKYDDGLAGLNYYVESIGYKLDTAATGTFLTDNNGGSFTFDDYKAEIDAGRAVIVNIKGHSMIGYGYDSETKEIIFDDTYEKDQRMTWGGSYNYAGENRALTSISVIVFDKDSLGGDPEPDPDPTPAPDPKPDPLPTDNPLGPRSDINGDGKTDLFFVTAAGDTWVWWNGESSLGEAMESNTGNHFVGTGDFDGNGQDDLLWNEGDGKLVVWYGGEKGDRATLGDADFTKHSIVSTVDFDNNGKNDVLWECADGIVGLWVDGKSSQWQYIGTNGNQSWSIVKAGDFDGSGKNDILWTDGIGNYGLWLDGTTEWKDLGRSGSLAWEVATTGRFTAGDRDDILWYNKSTSEIGVWTTNSEGAKEWRSIGCAGSTDWTVVGAGNFGGTGIDDIIWENTVTGEVGVWVDADASKWQSYGVAGLDYKSVIGVA